MSKTWLVFDMDCMAYGAFFTTGFMHNAEVQTGVSYGVLRSIERLQSLYNTNDVIFCFDHGEPLRLSICPTYKASRKKKREEMVDEDKQAWFGMKEQVKKLKLQYLPEMGYKNIFYQEGYEADDMIASVCNSTSLKDSVIIVSSDKDLYQLLSHRVMINVIGPKAKTASHYTIEDFIEEYNCHPKNWAWAKAIAGCTTDDVDGVEGVGEKSAIAYINGELQPWSAKYMAIRKAEDLVATNLHLVELPYEGTKPFLWQGDQVTMSKTRVVLDGLGFNFIMGQTG